MRKRTAARRIALQALYQWDLRGEEFLPQLGAFLSEWARTPEEAQFAQELVLGCREHRAEIDARLEALAENWSLARMAALDRNILRLAAYELMFRPDIPPKASIDEAVALAKKFSTEDSGAFVNGVLDPLMASLAPGRRPEPDK
jgi:transcription antitermination factor NusB